MFSIGEAESTRGENPQGAGRDGQMASRDALECTDSYSVLRHRSMSPGTPGGIRASDLTTIEA